MQDISLLWSKHTHRVLLTHLFIPTMLLSLWLLALLTFSGKTNKHINLVSTVTLICLHLTICVKHYTIYSTHRQSVNRYRSYIYLICTSIWSSDWCSIVRTHDENWAVSMTITHSLSADENVAVVSRKSGPWIKKLVFYVFTLSPE